MISRTTTCRELAIVDDRILQGRRQQNHRPAELDTLTFRDNIKSSLDLGATQEVSLLFLAFKSKQEKLRLQPRREQRN
jgi:hypothetical protein